MKWGRKVKDPVLQAYLNENRDVQVGGKAKKGVRSKVCLMRRDNEKFILKFSAKSVKKYVNHIKQEIEVLEKCKEANIIGVSHIIKYFEIPNIGIFLEKEYIEKTHSFKDIQNNQESKEMLLETINQIHQLGYAIKDIATQNIRIKNKRPYIIDLGYCRKITEQSDIDTDLEFFKSLFRLLK